MLQNTFLLHATCSSQDFWRACGPNIFDGAQKVQVRISFPLTACGDVGQQIQRASMKLYAEQGESLTHQIEKKKSETRVLEAKLSLVQKTLRRLAPPAEEQQARQRSAEA